MLLLSGSRCCSLTQVSGYLHNLSPSPTLNLFFLLIGKSIKQVYAGVCGDGGVRSKSNGFSRLSQKENTREYSTHDSVAGVRRQDTPPNHWQEGFHCWLFTFIMNLSEHIYSSEKPIFEIDNTGHALQIQCTHIRKQFLG